MATAAPANEPRERFWRVKALVTSARTRMSGVGQLIKNNKRWLAFIGAFVVFATFIVKEGVRDISRM